MNDKQLHYFNDTKKHIEAKGGKLLSTRYIDSRSPLDVECQRGHKWTPSRDSIISGRWCAKCKGNSNDGKREEIIKYITSHGGRLIGEYINADTHITVECLELHQWSIGPYWLLQGNWCRKCSDRERLAKEEFYQIVKDKNGKVEGNYEGVRSIMRFICEFGHIWEAAVQDIKKGRWCQACNTGYERAKQEFYEIVQAKGGKADGVYENNRSRFKLTCAKGHHWEAYAFSIKTGTWCPHCCRSVGEEKIADFLHSLHINFIPQFRHPLIYNRRYDMMFIYNNTRYIIEFDGMQHFIYDTYFHKSNEDFLFKQEIDRIKTYVAITTGYQIIRIDYTQINNIAHHIQTALDINNLIYVSTPELYDGWLLGAKVSVELLKKECPALIN